MQSKRIGILPEFVPWGAPKGEVHRGGHPEALRGGGDITWSRHITAHDRIIYDIYEEVVEVYILEVEGHYNDK
ncbi:hypothetical protein GAO41_33400 [Bacteroides thetaiotaomicron]|nr:hypothetical protein GAO41_33400 [Bacteroides thetaiotaomicron]